MRSTHTAIAALTILLTTGLTTSAAAQSIPPGRTPSPRVPRQQLENAARAAAKLVMKPKVSCGMTIVPADPAVDSKLLKPAPDRTVKPTIRQVPPGVCR